MPSHPGQCRRRAGRAPEHDGERAALAPGRIAAIELRPWLYRVARNESISLLRRRRTVAEPDEALLPSQPAADVTFEARERLRTLVADLAALPERQRSALVMRELSGLKYEEIAGH